MKKLLFTLIYLLMVVFIQAQSDSLRKLDPSKWGNNADRFYANQFSDSLKLVIRAQGPVGVIIASSDLSLMLDTNLQFNLLICDFQDFFESKIGLFTFPEHYRLDYYPVNQTMRMTILDTSKVYSIGLQTDEVRKSVPSNECVIHTQGLRIHLYFPSISALLDTTLQEKVGKYVCQLSEHEWKNTKLAYGNGYFDEKVNIGYREKSDNQIAVNLYTGISFVKSSFVALTEIKLGYSFKKNDYRREFMMGYDWNFVFNADGTRSVNSFLNFSILEDGFLPNLKTLAGIDMGYLIFRQGDVFEKNTFRLGFGFKGDFFYFSPQIYFPGSFKGVYPGLRMCIGL